MLSSIVTDKNSDSIQTKDEYICSPKRKNTYDSYGSCFMDNEKEIIIDSLNRHSPRSIDKYIKDAELIKELKTLSSKCYNSECNFELESLMNHLNNIIRPIKPHIWYVNNNEWLSNIDIEKVMVQYIDEYFDFLGVSTLDYGLKHSNNVCMYPRLCDTNEIITKLLDMGKKSFGVVFNLCREHEQGTHWVAVYCNIDPNSPLYGICYYDSTVKDPPPDLSNFLENIHKSFMNRKKDKRFKIKKNTMRNQFRNSECGMFCLVFLILCIENADKKHVKYKYICNAIGDDNKVNKFRDILFAPL